MKNRALQHSLKTKRWLSIPPILLLAQQWRGGIDKFDEISPKFLNTD